MPGHLQPMAMAALVVGVATASASGRVLAGPAQASVPDASFSAGRIRFEPLDGTRPLGVAGIGDYRGELDVVPGGGGLAVVNDVGMDDYVDGISEMPPTWPPAALQAQAIAARTYALYHLGQPRPASLAAIGADICADQDCQVYTGLAHEREPGAQAWLRAVAATRDQVLEYHGAPIDAMYSSSNGGRSVAGGEPYLPSVADPDDAASPLHHWEVDLAPADVAAALGLAGTVTSVTRSGDTVTVTWRASVPGPAGAKAPAGGSNPVSPATTPPDSALPIGRGGTTTTTSPLGALLPPARAGTATATTVTTPGQATTVTTAGPTTTGPARTAPATTAPATTAPATTGPATTAPATTAPTRTPTTTDPISTPAGPTPPASATPADSSVSLAAATFVSAINGALPAPAGRDMLVPSYEFGVSMTPSAVVLVGAGFGHGIGMSQYGALGKALRGLSAGSILAAYYGGIRPATMSPSPASRTIGVALAENLGEVTITGRFRVVDGHDHVLVTVADGPWRVVPGGRGLVRVIPPAGYGRPLALGDLVVEPPVVVPRSRVFVQFTLPVPALVTVTAHVPGRRPVSLGPSILDAGRGSVALPPAPAAGVYRLTVAAVAVAGRGVSAPLDFTVGTPLAAVPSLERFSVATTRPGAVPVGSWRALRTVSDVTATLLLVVAAATLVGCTRRRRLLPSTVEGSPAHGRDQSPPGRPVRSPSTTDGVSAPGSHFRQP